MKKGLEADCNDDALMKMIKNLEEIVQRKSINDVIAQALNFQIQVSLNDFLILCAKITLLI